MRLFANLSIGARIGLLLLAAVLPLALVGTLFAYIGNRTEAALAREALLESAGTAATAIDRTIERSSAVGDLAVMLVSPAPDRCNTQLNAIVKTLTGVAAISVYENGRRICGATGEAASALAAHSDTLTDAALGSSVVVAGEASFLRIARGSNGAAFVLDVPFAVIWPRMRPLVSRDPSWIFIAGSNGNAIDDSGILSGEKLAVALAPGQDMVSYSDHAGGGYVARAPVGNSGLTVGTFKTTATIQSSLLSDLWRVLAIPAFLLVVAVTVAWVGVDRLVNRWVRRLGLATRAYGDGDLSARVGPIPEAPEEFRSLGASFDAMASRIEARSLDLQRALADKDHFVRELHHRVKNNLQMIGSLLTLQRRECDPASAAAIREAHDRIQALAAAYRASYQEGETGSVPVRTLVTDLFERLRESAGLAHPVTVVDEVDASGSPLLSIHIDRAVPFALLLAELTAPVLSGSGMQEVVVSLRRSSDDPAFVESRIMRADNDPQKSIRVMEGHPLGDRLARAYAAQLGATVTRSPTEIVVRMPSAA